MVCKVIFPPREIEILGEYDAKGVFHFYSDNEQLVSPLPPELTDQEWEQIFQQEQNYAS